MTAPVGFAWPPRVDPGPRFSVKGSVMSRPKRQSSQALIFKVLTFSHRISRFLIVRALSEQKGPIMTTMVVRHDVADYDTWRKVYDEVEPLRSQYGVSAQRVLKETGGDGNSLLVIHEFPSADQARAFAESDELAQAMQRAGVAGPPRIELYDGIE